METFILFCPVCCSPTDASEGQTEHECAVCSQQWTMVISPARVAEHSPA